MDKQPQLPGSWAKDVLCKRWDTPDYDARVLISAELGHGREQITTAYLGR